MLAFYKSVRFVVVLLVRWRGTSRKPSVIDRRVKGLTGALWECFRGLPKDESLSGDSSSRTTNVERSGGGKVERKAGGYGEMLSCVLMCAD